MKPRSIALSMILLILVNTLGLTVYAPKIVAEDAVAEALDETISETPKIDNEDSTYNVDKSGEVVNGSFEQSAGGETLSQNETLGSTQQTYGDRGNNWDFNDTSGWSNFAYTDGNMTKLVVGIDGEKPASYTELEKIAAKHQAKIVNTVSIRGEIRAVVVELPSESVSAFVGETRVVEWANYIEPSMEVQAQIVPNDPYWIDQWGPQKIEADWAWNTTLGDPSILVAVVDTGVDYTHPDLAANYVPLGYDWVNNDTDPWDDNGHGTHVSGIIAAVINNGIGIAGLAQVRIMAEKVLDMRGRGYSEWVASGIIHAVDQGADIISMSLGGYGYSELVYEAIRYAYNSGVLLIAAAGNEDTNMKLYPAGYDEVIAVAATDQWDNKAWFSNWGEWIELAAPGVGIYSTVPWGYESWSGTSMATPHVSGVAALVWSRFPNKTRDWVRLWLRYTADDLGDPGFDIYYGYGRINARKAIEQSPPAHELVAYEWKTPPYVEPASLATINATVLNFGESNETDIVVQLLVNDTVTNYVSIAFLASGETATISLTWNPVVEGLYNVTFYVVPVPSEISIKNNALWRFIYVGIPLKAVVLQSAGNFFSDIITNWQILNSEWYLFGDTMVYIDYTTLDKDHITYEDIAATEADVLIISCAFDPGMGWQFTDSEIEAIKRYVLEGHGLIATAGTLYYWVPNNNKLAPLFGLNETTMWSVTGTDLLHLLNITHPLFRNVPDPFVFAMVGTAIPYDGRWDSNELAGGTYMALGHFEESAIVTYRGLMYISPWLEIIPSYYHHHLQLLYNAITWSRYQKPEHELIVSLEAPRHLQPGESALLNATVSNMGLNKETNVELYLLIDGAIVDSKMIPELDVGASSKISYLWTPSLEKVYNITAYSPRLPDEELTLNNVDSAIVHVRFVRFVLWDDTKDMDGDSLTGNYLSLYNLLTAAGFLVDELTVGPINSSILANYHILVLMDPELDFSSAEIAEIQNWVAANGTVIIIPDGGYPPTLNTLMAPYGVQMTGRVGGFGTTTDIIGHPITQGVGTIYVNWVREISVASPSTCLAWVTAYGERFAFLSATEGGEVAVISDSNIMDNYGLEMADNTQLMLNMFNWAKPVHDLAVMLDAPPFLEPGVSVLLNATVRNRGSSNETNVELRLLINGTLVNSTLIPELPADGTRARNRTLSYLWTPEVEGTYNVTAYVPPVPNEEFTTNNIVTKLVKVRPIKGYILFDQTHGTDSIIDYSLWVANLFDRQYVIETHLSGPITSTILCGYEILVIPQAHYDYSSDELSAIQNFVLNGGGLLVIGDDNPWIYTALTSFAGISWIEGGWGGYTTDIAPHPVTHRVTTAYFATPLSYLLVASPALGLIRDEYGYIMLAASEIGAGKVLGIADEHSINDFYIGYADNVLLANDMIDWMSRLYKHDVAIVDVASSASEVLAGDTVDIVVVAENQGNFTESFTVTAYASSSNSTRIYLDPSNYIFDTSDVYIGYKFNVTVKVHDVTDLAAWQIRLYYNDSIINATRWFEPFWDPTYVFYGRSTLPLPTPPHIVYSHLGPGIGYVQVASLLLPMPQPGDGFTGDGLMGIIEFEVTAIPSPGETLSSSLAIDNEDTKLVDSDATRIPCIKENGYYALSWGGPPPPPPRLYRIGTITVTNLAPGARITLTFTWNTTGVIADDYVIWSEAGAVPGETDTTDNKFIDGIVKVMKPPLANFTCSPLFPKPGETVIFNATSSTPNGGTIVNYNWDFGDGNVTATTDPIITHTYAFSGLYNVTLTIEDSEGLTDSTWKTIYVFTRDIAIVDVTPSTNQTYVGRTISINVTILNEGEVTETFDVILYYNITAGDIIGTQIVIDMLPGEYRTLSFLWDTTGVKPCYNCTITAYAIPVLGETDIADNIRSSPFSVKVKLLGDINGDGIVDIDDIVPAALAFGSYPDHPRWNLNSDLNNDNIIDIDDIIVIAINFGKTVS
jgi:subtilisin family serine protease/PKD repeat protein